MTRYRRATGIHGEDQACVYLEKQGYRIKTRGFRAKAGEIDIVAEKGGTTVFVEVKTRKGDEYGEPIESVTEKKASRIRNVAAEYMSVAGFATEVRFDVICVFLDRDGAVLRLEHIENAF